MNEFLHGEYSDLLRIPQRLKDEMPLHAGHEWRDETHSHWASICTGGNEKEVVYCVGHPGNWEVLVGGKSVHQRKEEEPAIRAMYQEYLRMLIEGELG